jgi:hypothetical protein
MSALRLHLLANPDIEHVFYDFASMPQGAPPPSAECARVGSFSSPMCSLSAGTRTPEEQRAFMLMLVNINILYLGYSVLILADESYMGRFWTQACKTYLSDTPPP